MNIYKKGILFKGFVHTKDKKCLEPFKNRTDFNTYEQVKGLPEFAGILEDGIVLIDVDDLTESNILFEIVKGEKLNCVVMKTTRGKHFYFKNDPEIFKNNRTHASLACGIQADIKLGTKNSYAIVKFKDQEREILYKPDMLGIVPVWMQAIPEKTNFQLSEGDGRNQALFNYILPLQRQGMSVEDIRTTIRIINEYVLSEALSESELEVILRDEAFKKQAFFKGTKFLHDQFANYLKNNYHIIRINGNIMMYLNGIYEGDSIDIEKIMIKEIPSLKASQRKEVILQLNLICDDKVISPSKYIAFRNGILNVESGDLLPFSTEYIITNKIPWDFNRYAYDELADKTLNKIACGDKQIRMIIEEMIGACFYRSQTLEGGKAFILTGTGSNGKSTVLEVIRRILGENNYSSLDLKNLDDRFSTVRIFGKLANIGDDISDEFISDVSTFKKIVTGDEIEAEQKGQPKFDFKPFCKLLFSANSIPRIKDKTGAAQRRLLIVPFNANFSKKDDDYDPEIRSKLTNQSAIEYFINLGIQGLQRVLDNKQFTPSEKVEQELEDYAEKNNPVKTFIKDCEEMEVMIAHEPVVKVFEKYREYCIRNGFTALAMNEFSRQMKNITGLTTIRKRLAGDKNKVTIFIEK